MLLFSLIALMLIPIWIVQYPSLQDYYNHLLKAKVLLDYSNSAMNYSNFYSIVHLPVPNSASTLVMAFLMMFFQPMVAGKIFLSIYVVLFPLSAMYLIRAAGSEIRPLHYIGFAFVYNPCFLGGYIDFCLSAAVVQFAVGYWLKTRNQINFGVGVKYTGFVLLTYLSHFWGLAILLGITGLLMLRESHARKLLWISCAVLAAALLGVYSRVTGERLTADYYGFTYLISIIRNFLSLPRLGALPMDSLHLATAGTLIILRLGLLVSFLYLALKRRTPLFWITVLMAVGYFIVPTQLGRMYEPGQRILVMIPALFAASVAAMPTKRITNMLAIIMAICIVLPVAAATVFWGREDRNLVDYSSVLSRIPAHKSVLHVIMLPAEELTGLRKLAGSDVYRPEGFFGANYNIQKGGFYLHTFTTGIVKVRPEIAPVSPWFIMQENFFWPDWLEKNHSVVSRNFDYIVLVGASDRAYKVLQTKYKKQFKTGYVELLVRRGSHGYAELR